MKKFALLLTAIMTVACFVGCGEKKETEDTSNGTLTMVTEAGFAPYEFMPNGKDIEGIDVEIAKQIAKSMKKKLVINNISFENVIPSVQSGKADFAAAGLSIDEKRKEQVDFSIEYATSKIVLVVKKDNSQIKSPDDLTKDTKIGVQMGNTADLYVQDTFGTKDHQYSKFLQAAEDLKNDKIDCIMMDSLPAEKLVKANKNFKILDKEVFTDKYALAVKKGNTELLDDINKILKKLIDEGKIDEYTIKYSK